MNNKKFNNKNCEIENRERGLGCTFGLVRRERSAKQRRGRRRRSCESHKREERERERVRLWRAMAWRAERKAIKWVLSTNVGSLNLDSISFNTSLLCYSTWLVYWMVLFESSKWDPQIMVPLQDVKKKKLYCYCIRKVSNVCLIKIHSALSRKGGCEQCREREMVNSGCYVCLGVLGLVGAAGIGVGRGSCIFSFLIAHNREKIQPQIYRCPF